eukprot:g11765.t1
MRADGTRRASPRWRQVLGQATCSDIFAKVTGDGNVDEMTLAKEVLRGILQALPARKTTVAEHVKMTEQVFAALLVPSQRTVRLLKEGQMALPKALNCHLLADGLRNVPFVLPDFPVPIHLLKSIQLKPAEIAKDRDFYISGLISLEELQVSLPYLLQIRKLEEAVELILRSSRFFTQHEWQKYVYSIRGEDSQAKTEEPDEAEKSIDEPTRRSESPKAVCRIPEDSRLDPTTTLRHFLEEPPHPPYPTHFRRFVRVFLGPRGGSAVSFLDKDGMNSWAVESLPVVPMEAGQDDPTPQPPRSLEREFLDCIAGRRRLTGRLSTSLQYLFGSPVSLSWQDLSLTPPPLLETDNSPTSPHEPSQELRVYTRQASAEECVETCF